MDYARELDMLRVELQQAEADLDACRRIIGQVICAGTLAPGERLSEPLDHAAVGAIVRMVEQRDGLRMALDEANEIAGDALKERDAWRRMALGYERSSGTEYHAGWAQLHALGIDPATGKQLDAASTEGDGGWRVVVCGPGPGEEPRANPRVAKHADGSVQCFGAKEQASAVAQGISAGGKLWAYAASAREVADPEWRRQHGLT